MSIIQNSLLFDQEEILPFLLGGITPSTIDLDLCIFATYLIMRIQIQTEIKRNSTFTISKYHIIILSLVLLSIDYSDRVVIFTTNGHVSCY